MREFWFNRVTKSLSGEFPRQITKRELQQQIEEILNEVTGPGLPDNFGDQKPPADTETPDIMRKQIELVNGGARRIARARKVRWQSRNQRQRWMDGKVTFCAQLDKFDQRLIDAWSDQHGPMCDDTAAAPETEKQRRGCEILDWTHNDAAWTLIKVGTKIAPTFLVQGTYHISSWRTKVGLDGIQTTKRSFRNARTPMRTISADTYAMSNPALTSLLLWQFAKSYRETGGAAPALPLSFIVLPIAMSGPAIRSFAGTNQATGFLTWLSRSPEQLIELAGNIADARDLTSEALSFGIAYRLFTINFDGALAANSNAVNLKKTDLRMEERGDMLRVAQRLGSWTSQLPDANRVLLVGDCSMSRWQLKGIYLFSHDSRRREITFDLNAVNIITGPSGSGKSAICEIIDYCLGAGECHIPDLVRESTSWPSILLSNGTTEAFIARRMPPPDQLSSEETFLAFGSQLEVPPNADAPRGTTNTSTLLKRIEQLVGIGNVTTEVFDANRQPKRIIARSVTPFLLQSDDVIINKTVLFRGAQDERRGTIIDSFPYFLGIIDETTFGKEQELRRLIAQRIAEERRIALAERQRDTLALSLRSIAAEAKSVGLIDISIQAASIESLRSALQSVASWMPDQDGAGGNDRLTELSNHEGSLRNERSRLLLEISESREASKEASQFVTTTERQQRRLQVVDLFGAADAPVETCPVCLSRIMQHTDTLAKVRAAYRELRSQLRSAERERPQIDDYISALQARIEALGSELQGVTAQLRAVLRESGSLQERLNLAQRRMRAAGRVSYYLEIGDEVAAPLPTGRLDMLNPRIAELQDEIDSVNKVDRLQDAQRQVGMSADDILKDLPFASPYPQRSVYLNTRDLSTGVLTEQRRIPMRDIGSDENYLSLHISVALGLHRYFKLHGRPVPGFIVFDQPSRPFYPPDKRPEIVDTHSDADRGALKQYFDVLFKEVAEQQDLQIIVLEHAFFADDERFIKAAGKRYLDPEKLIPEGWPQVK